MNDFWSVYFVKVFVYKVSLQHMHMVARLFAFMVEILNPQPTGQIQPMESCDLT